MKDLFFPVVKTPLDELGFNYPVPSGSSHAIVKLQESGEVERVLSFCSGDYGLTRNLEIYQTFQGLIDQAGMATKFAYTNREDVIFRMSWALQKVKVAMQVGDVVALGLEVYNSYNRKQKFTFSTYVERLVCSNGLTMPTLSKSKVSRHTEAIEGYSSAELCIPMLQEAMDQFEDSMEPYYDLVSTPVSNLENRVKAIVNNTEFPVSLVEPAMERMILEMSQFNLPQNDWLVFNGLNWALENSSSFFGRKKMVLEREVLDFLLSN